MDTREEKFNDYLRRMEAASKLYEVEAHEEADKILREVALNAELSNRQRRQIVVFYDTISRYFT